jgi:hypothetical protein
MKLDIQEVIGRYWDGNTTPDEEASLRAYFNGQSVEPQLLPFQELFQYFDAQSALKYDQYGLIKKLMDKYWEAETSLEEEKLLKMYFNGDDVAEEFKPFRDLFLYHESKSQINYPDSKDMDILLERYWDGDTTLEEEKAIRQYYKDGHVKESHKVYADMFKYFEVQSKTKMVDNQENRPKIRDHKNVIPLRKVIYGAAAVALLVLSSILVMKNISSKENTSQQTASVYEVEDPEEALRVTKEALALVSKKFRASQQAVKENMGALEKAAIFK